MENAISMGLVYTEGTIQFFQIDDLFVHAAVNEHGTMTISGILEKEMVKELNESPLKDGFVCVHIEGETRPLFSGVIEGVRLEERGKLSYVTIDCTSFTILLDRKRRSQSFQDTTIRYRDILERVGANSDIKERILITALNAGKQIGTPIIQYEETDWEFYKRIAGKLHTIIIPEITYVMPQFSIGLIKGKTYELPEINEYQESMNLERYRSNVRAQGKSYFVSYQIRSNEIYEIGDKIRWQDKELVVMEKELYVEHGCIEGIYVLGYEAGFSVSEYKNEKVRGVSLPGIVIDTKEGAVKVHLEIDEIQDKETAYWYRYSPITGNIMYSVPECGARVLLNIMSEREEDAIVSGCIRTNSEILPQPETKTMWSGNERYIAAPEYLGFSYESVKSLEALFLDDELGIVVNSGKNLTVRANGRLMIRSDGEIYISGVTHTELRHPNAVKEQAWIALDCGEIRLGGDSIVQSGGIINGSCDSEKSLDILSTRKVVRAVLDMMPITRSTASYENSQVDLQAAACVMDMVQENQMYSFASNETSGKVNTLDESKDSQDDNEMKAEIYVNGLCFEGYVNKTDNETYVSQSRYEELKQTTGFSLVENSEEIGMILSIEYIAKKLNLLEFLSSWNQEENLRIIICHPTSKNCHYKLIRKDRNITIKLYAHMTYVVIDKNGTTTASKDTKPYLTHPFTNIYDLCRQGVELWEGEYRNRYDPQKELWYDDFGVDGVVNVEVEIYFDTQEFRAENNIPLNVDLAETANNDYQKVYGLYIVDNRKAPLTHQLYAGGRNHTADDNRSYTVYGVPWAFDKDVSIIGFMGFIGYVDVFGLTILQKVNYTKTQFVEMIGHETGHLMGLADAYKRSKEVDKNGNLTHPDQVGFKKTDEINNTMMNDNSGVTDNDVEMLIEAWKTKSEQYFYDCTSIRDDYVKSKVIRQEEKMDKEWYDKALGVIYAY